MLDSFHSFGDIVPSIDDKRRQLFIDHLEFMRKHPTTQVVTIDSRYSFPEKHSFYGYCQSMQYERTQIFPIMLLNGLSDVTGFTPRMGTLTVPSAELVQKILASMGE